MFFGIFGRKRQETPESVFTPNADEKTEMYVARPELEGELAKIIRQEYVFYLYGFSGSGKTWLYQKVFGDRRIHFDVVDAAANSFGNFESIFDNFLASKGRRKKSREETTIGNENVATHKVSDTFREKDPALEAMQYVGQKRRGVLIIENIEAISSDVDSIKGLGNFIRRCLSGDYRKSGVRILLVGTDRNLQKSLASLHNQEPILRRLRMLPEVSRFSRRELIAFLKKGFRDKLQFRLAQDLSYEEFATWVDDMTNSIASYVHRVCLVVAEFASENNSEISKNLLESCQEQWKNDSDISQAISVVESLMNEREKLSVRDKVLYCLSRLRRYEFKSADVHKIVKEIFSDQRDPGKTNITTALYFLSGKNPSGIAILDLEDATFRFRSPVYKFAISLALHRTADGGIRRVV